MSHSQEKNLGRPHLLEEGQDIELEWVADRKVNFYVKEEIKVKGRAEVLKVFPNVIDRPVLG